MSITSTLQQFSLENVPVCVHASLSSMTPRIPADTILDAFLEHGCTVLVPSFTYHFECAPTNPGEWQRNGMLAREFSSGTAPGYYQTSDNAVSADMGQFPACLLQRKDRVRGDHPLNAFAALGPVAGSLIAGQTPTDVYAPLRELVKQGGKVLLVGTGLTSLTLVHYAEQLAGRQLFVRWAKNAQGQTIPVRVGSCSAGFDRLTQVVAPASRTLTVQNATWTLIDAAEAISRMTDTIATEPDITSCGRADCLRCQDAIAGGPLLA